MVLRVPFSLGLPPGLVAVGVVGEGSIADLRRGVGLAVAVVFITVCPVVGGGALDPGLAVAYDIVLLGLLRDVVDAVVGHVQAILVFAAALLVEAVGPGQAIQLVVDEGLSGRAADVVSGGYLRPVGDAEDIADEVITVGEVLELAFWGAR